jgi:hypothetical protein
MMNLSPPSALPGQVLGFGMEEGSARKHENSWNRQTRGIQVLQDSCFPCIWNP